MYDTCKQTLYGDDSCPSQLQSLAEDLLWARVEGKTDDKLCSLGEGGTDGKDLLSVCTCMCGSARDCWCMIDGTIAMVASSVLLVVFVIIWELLFLLTDNWMMTYMK